MEENKAERDGDAQPKKLFGKGVYGSKDVPIRMLDKLIVMIIVTIVAMVILFTINGGYNISFDTDGGTEVDSQKIRYGELIEEPEAPIKAGYTLQKWVTSDDETLAVEWEFANDEVVEDMILYAIWVAADVTVKFDLDGGVVDGSESASDIEVVYGETYGTLPEVAKEGYLFDGWVYSGNIITAETIVTMTGEHILTARWIEE